MDKETSIVQQKPFKKKSRYNVYVFLVCLIFSTLIWLFLKFSKDYNVVVDVGIDYVNVPNDKFILKADTSFSITVRINGLKLLLRKVPKKERIKINLARVNFKKMANTHLTGNVEIRNYVENLISAQIPFAEKIEDISPPIVSLELDNAFGKKVPVKAIYSYTLGKQYFIYSPIKIEPDCVLVYGLKSKIEKIQYVETDSMAFNNLKENQESRLVLKENNKFDYRLSQKNVKIFIPVEKFTEMELNVPIFIPDYKAKKHIKIFPESMTVFLDM